jgi:N-methylhydantoinase A/oxoprolinase/acetone carboxylase beta subunit
VDAFDGAALQPGATITGPALVDASDTTIWIPAAVHTRVDGRHTLIGELNT